MKDDAHFVYDSATQSALLVDDQTFRAITAPAPRPRPLFPIAWSSLSAHKRDVLLNAWNAETPKGTPLAAWLLREGVRL